MSFTGLLGDWLRKINNSITSLSINGPTVTYNKHDGTVGTETINLDSIYAKLTGTLADNIVTRTSPSGRTAQLISHGTGNTYDYEIMDVGWNFANRDGAVLGLRSSSHPTQAGHFQLNASNDTDSAVLIGKPDGSLTWNGKSLINNGVFNKMFFSQTSGNYVAPYTGVYRITLKGGGGGGGGAQTDRYATGGGGGEGGTIIFYATLTKGQSYAYTIGAGGAAGANGADNLSTTNGDTGGTSTFVVGDVTYSVTGGEGGTRRYSSGRGGLGGRVKTPNNNNIYLIPGARGGNGVATDSGTSYIDSSPVGGGAGVSYPPYPSIYGGGGNGGGPLAVNMTNVLEPTAGGNGYILIEYAR